MRTAASTATTLTMAWDPQDLNPCPTNDYVVEYALLNKDECEDFDNSERILFGYVTDEFVVITGLYLRSTYQVFVYPRNGLGDGVEMSLTSVTEGSGKICLSVCIKDI